MRSRNWLLTLVLGLALAGCSDDGGEEDEPRVGYEIMQIKSLDEIIVWVSREITQAEFDSIELPQDWFKNQPRESDPDGGFFARTPGAAADGDFTYEEHFGHEWMHNATIIEANVPLDEDGLLRRNMIAKHHTVTFNAGRTLKVLVSPLGERYVRITRDAGRASDTPTLPQSWTLLDYVTPEALDIELPNPTVNIRCDNEDSFQGPVPDLPVGEEPPLELTPELCDDPSNMEALADAMGDGGDPTYGQTNMEQAQRMAMAPTEGPFYMVNLIKYRDQAVYPDGRETDLTGREANALYSPTEFLEAIGARPVFVGAVTGTTLGAAGTWDEVAIVEYPCPLALFAMSAHPEFQARSIHKEAGLEKSIVMVTHLQALGNVEPADPPFPPTAEDPAFELVRVFALREQAEYPPDSGEPARTGQEALDLYSAGVAADEQRLGLYPKARLKVQGVMIGDGRDFDEVWIDYVPSGAAFDALAADPDVVAAIPHRDAALADAYGLKVDAMLSAIPDGEGGDPDEPTVTEDGTGTVCSSDADCQGLTAAHCLSEGGLGICTVEGCTAGTCFTPYECCHDCNPMAAPMLPFEGSACLPAEATGMLEGQAGCTCD